MFRTSYVHHQENYIVHAVWSTSSNLLYYLHKCMENIPYKAAMYSLVFLKMNKRCSKHVEDKEN